MDSERGTSSSARPRNGRGRIPRLSSEQSVVSFLESLKRRTVYHLAPIGPFYGAWRTRSIHTLCQPG